MNETATQTRFEPVYSGDLDVPGMLDEALRRAGLQDYGEWWWELQNFALFAGCGKQYLKAVAGEQR
jgi:hypothetical protein